MHRKDIAPLSGRRDQFLGTPRDYAAEIFCNWQRALPDFRSYRASPGAETYPSRPITMVAAFPAGGPTDTLARSLAAV